MPLDALDCMHRIPHYDPLHDADEYEFISELAEEKIDFIESQIVHTEGPLAGKPYILEPHQRGIQYMLWGWYHKRLKITDRIGRTRGIRRIKEALYYVSRKGSKSTDCAVTMNTIIFTEPDWRMQLYGCASGGRQSAKMFNIIAAQIRANPAMAERVRIYKVPASIDRLADHTIFQPLPDNADVEHGANVRACLCDEIHTYKSAALPVVMRTGMIAQQEPLLLYATTADYLRDSFCNRTLAYAKQVRDKVISDPRFLPMIWEPDPEKVKADPKYWQTEECWREANPMLGITITVETMRQECNRAIADPSYENEFKRLLCNIQTDSIEQMIPAGLWAKGDGIYPPGHFDGRIPIAAALDLSSSSDTTSLCLTYKDDKGVMESVWHHWLPRDSAEEQEREKSTPFSVWEREGWIKLTDGDQIDYDDIEDDIDRIFNQVGITKVFADPLFQGKQLCQRLMKRGYEMVYFACNAVNLTAPIEEMLRLLADGKIKHGNNALMRVQANNAMLVMRGDNLKHVSKRKSKGQIDGVMTLLMTMPAALSEEGKKISVYEKRGFITV